MMKKRIVQLLLAAAGLLCLGVGLALGGYPTPLSKAGRIFLAGFGFGKKKKDETAGLPAQMHPAGQRPAV